ncbi:MAG: caspase family protein [Rhodospirillales bacterium]|nr:caspase family protein [Rhodospirillales bacterium]
MAAAAPSGSGGEKRVALIIGNSAYKEAPLKNPVNDARAMAKTLREQGFEVILREDATKTQINDAVGEFGEKLSEGAVGLFFFAGHGIQVQGRNYMVPVDARITSEQRVRLETLDVEAVLDQMQAARTRVSMVILDACRNNPFERRFRSVSGGLAQINAPTGTLIAYATAPGKVAADGEGENGLYTQELLGALRLPGLKIEDVFKRVRVAVMQKSNESQIPWEASSLTGDFYFSPGAAASVASLTGPAAPIDPQTVELAFWDSVKGSNNQVELQAYIDKYPNGTFVALARSRLAALRAAKPAAANAAPAAPSAADKELIFWDWIKASTNPTMFQAYLEQYPSGNFAAFARVRLAELSAKPATAVATGAPAAGTVVATPPPTPQPTPSAAPTQVAAAPAIGAVAAVAGQPLAFRGIWTGIGAVETRTVRSDLRFSCSAMPVRIIVNGRRATGEIRMSEGWLAEFSARTDDAGRLSAVQIDGKWGIAVSGRVDALRIEAINLDSGQCVIGAKLQRESDIVPTAAAQAAPAARTTFSSSKGAVAARSNYASLYKCEPRAMRIVVEGDRAAGEIDLAEGTARFSGRVDGEGNLYQVNVDGSWRLLVSGRVDGQIKMIMQGGGVGICTLTYDMQRDDARLASAASAPRFSPQQAAAPAIPGARRAFSSNNATVLFKNPRGLRYACEPRSIQLVIDGDNASGEVELVEGTVEFKGQIDAEGNLQQVKVVGPWALEFSGRADKQIRVSSVGQFFPTPLCTIAYDMQAAPLPP